MPYMLKKLNTGAPQGTYENGNGRMASTGWSVDTLFLHFMGLREQDKEAVTKLALDTKEAMTTARSAADAASNKTEGVQENRYNEFKDLSAKHENAAKD